METTLEVRWFFRGLPPAVVQRWFRLECPGKLLETEIRTICMPLSDKNIWI